MGNSISIRWGGYLYNFRLEVDLGGRHINCDKARDISVNWNGNEFIFKAEKKYKNGK